MADMSDDEHEAFGAMHDPKMHARQVEADDTQTDFHPGNAIEMDAIRLYGIDFTQPSWENTGAAMRNFFRMRAAILAEREACAMILEDRLPKNDRDDWTVIATCVSETLTPLIAAIRARAN
jgi:hypothetical protein